jgi:DNA-binding response OmpR family regulator
MPHKILVVEDDTDLREVMQLYLANEGFTVIVARDGNEGIDIATKENPELIVTDAKMPVLDGVEMTKQLRAQSRFSCIPIIIVTGTGSRLRREAEMAGADEVLVKPVSPAGLVIEIDKLLNAKIPRQSSTQE